MKRKQRARKRYIVAGVSLLLVVLLTPLGILAYIWYTNAVQRHAQAELLRRWNESPPTPTASVGVGDGIARIVIPKLGLDAIVVELAGLDDEDSLKLGPGHIPSTAYPGGSGNVVISGHRTTYGAPFKYINELVPGDEMSCRYRAELSPTRWRSSASSSRPTSRYWHRMESPR